MSVTFPNETLNYRSARTALLEREVALRREMEAVAAELRACRRAAKCRKTIHSTASARTARLRRCVCPSYSAAETR